MKKTLFGLSLFILSLSLSLQAQYIKPVLGMCLNPSGVLIPIKGSGSGASGYIQQMQLFGMGANGTIPLSCDSNGYLIAIDINGALVPDSVAVSTNASGQLVQSIFKAVETPWVNTGSTDQTFVGAITVPASAMGSTSILNVMLSFSACQSVGNTISVCGYLASVTGVSGGGGFSGSGNVYLTNFNNGCIGATATVTLLAGNFASASVTAPGSGCTAAPTSATCTSGTASCTGSPVSITITSTFTAANAGTCTPTIFFSNTLGSGGTSVQGGESITAAYGANLLIDITNLTSSTQVSQSSPLGGNWSAATGVEQKEAVNTANASYINVFLTNSASNDSCIVASAYAQVIP